jgi:carbon monoxide dehydrogenase subunit G
VKVERTTDIAAPPEQVYDVVMDPRRLEEWVTIHYSLIEAPDGELKEGSELIQCLKLAGQKLKVRWRVIEDDCPKRVVWEGKGPVRSKARVVYEFERDGDRTRFSYTNEYQLPGGALGRLAGRSVYRVAAKETDATLQRLKQLIE